MARYAVKRYHLKIPTSDGDTNFLEGVPRLVELISSKMVGFALLIFFLLGRVNR